MDSKRYIFKQTETETGRQTDKQINTETETNDQTIKLKKKIIEQKKVPE